jgi:DNA polymerase-3 subunit delta'
MIMNIVGHADILHFFEQATQAGHLHHAYLFVGREQIGKRTVAEMIARQLFGTTDNVLHTNPDFFFLERGLNEKTGKTQKNISVDQVQTLRHFLQGKPFLYTKKVAIINDAELLSRGAMNALLKTLEEPRGHATVFLITSDAHALLDTIRSRCQTLYFHPVAEADIYQDLLTLNIDEHLARTMAYDASGCPGRARGWVADPDAYAWYRAEIARCESLFGKPLHAQLALVEDLFGKKEDHIATRTTLGQILDIWLLVVRDRYTHQSSESRSSYDIVQTSDAIVRAQKGLLQNINPRMLIESILLTIS